VLDAASDALVIHHAENEQNYTAPENLARGRGLALDRHGFRKRKDQRRPNNEREEWENQIVKVKPRPGRVLQPVVQAWGHWKHLRERLEHLLHADDEEHVHASKGIEGHETLRRRRRLNLNSAGRYGRPCCRR